MTVGRGKYDPECTKLFEETGAAAVIVIIFDGTKGTGFSCTGKLGAVVDVPAVLRVVAGQIEKDVKFSRVT